MMARSLSCSPGPYPTFHCTSCGVCLSSHLSWFPCSYRCWGIPDHCRRHATWTPWSVVFERLRSAMCCSRFGVQFCSVRQELQRHTYQRFGCHRRVPQGYGVGCTHLPTWDVVGSAGLQFMGMDFEVRLWAFSVQRSKATACASHPANSEDGCSYGVHDVARLGPGWPHLCCKSGQFRHHFVSPFSDFMASCLPCKVKAVAQASALKVAW